MYIMKIHIIQYIKHNMKVTLYFQGTSQERILHVYNVCSNILYMYVYYEKTYYTIQHEGNTLFPGDLQGNMKVILDIVAKHILE